MRGDAQSAPPSGTPGSCAPTNACPPQGLFVHLFVCLNYGQDYCNIHMRRERNQDSYNNFKNKYNEGNQSPYLETFPSISRRPGAGVSAEN